MTTEAMSAQDFPSWLSDAEAALSGCAGCEQLDIENTLARLQAACSLFEGAREWHNFAHVPRVPAKFTGPMRRSLLSRALLLSFASAHALPKPPTTGEALALALPDDATHTKLVLQPRTLEWLRSLHGPV